MTGRPRARDYAPELTTIGAPQRFGVPRPGRGIVYVRTDGGTPRYPDVTWVASWIDEFEQPNPDGEIAGIEDFHGTRDEVLAWARSRPAAQRLIPSGDGWIPLPDNDNEVHLRGDA